MGGEMTGVHILWSRVDAIEKRRKYCSNCDARRTFVMWFQEWYGWHVTCLGCGEQWQDGERLDRPFERGWRQQNIETARKLWKKHARPH